MRAARGATFGAWPSNSRRRPTEAFGAAWEDEAARPLAWLAERLERNAVFGARGLAGRPGLAGVAGLTVPDAPKPRYKGVLWGMCVRPRALRVAGRYRDEALVALRLDGAGRRGG